MKGIDIIAAFELEINKIDNVVDKPVTDDSIYWINQGAMKFTKDRFNGNAPKRTSYEQNEKRTRDLIKLFRETTCVFGYPKEDEEDSQTETSLFAVQSPSDSSISDDLTGGQSQELEPSHGGQIDSGDPIDVDPSTLEPVNPGLNPTEESTEILPDMSHVNYDVYEYTYPDGSKEGEDKMLYVLNEDVVISDLNDEHLMDTCVFECTADNFMYRINNSLTDFHYRHHRARPLRVRTSNGFKLLTDKKYKIKQYTLGYLKVPEEITPQDPFKDYTDFEDNIWAEIVKIAAQMYIENQGDSRYNTLTQEVLTQE